MNIFRVGLYLLAIFTSLVCTIFLVLGYRRRRLRMLMWSALCFAALTVNNVILFIDLVLLPQIDLRPARLIAALAGTTILLYSFIWEAE